MVRTCCSEKLPMKRDVWNENFVTNASKQRTGNSTCFSKKSGLRRSGKSWRQRWSNEQKPDPRHKNFTPQEEELIIKLHAAIGSRWPIIAQQLPGRTETDVKILWNTKLRKKLSAMGIDPVTHKPFSQILADYGNMGPFPKPTTQFMSSLSPNLHNPMTIFKHQQPQTHQYQPTFSNPDNNSLRLYTQFQAINMVTSDTSNNTDQGTQLPVHFIGGSSTSTGNECVSSMSDQSLDQETFSSFSWNDFLLEDAFLPLNSINEDQGNAGIAVDGQYCDDDDDEEEENVGGKQNSGAAVVLGREDDKNINNRRFEDQSSSSKGSNSFVEALLEHQDEMFSQFPGFYDQPIYDF